MVISMKRTAGILTGLVAVICCRMARGEHFSVRLSIDGPQGIVSATTDPPSDPHSRDPTLVCHAGHGDRLVLEWFVTSIFPHRVLKQVNVHYFIVPEASGSIADAAARPPAAPSSAQIPAPTERPNAGQGAPPSEVSGGAGTSLRPADPPDEPLGNGAILDGRFVVDLKPKGKVGLRQHFRIDRPGSYLVRVQSEKSDATHEHFSQLWLIVE